ncbi:MAG: roadblock/LC7 domain-containing protein [Candidatus Micrarchaeia archaeon]
MNIKKASLFIFLLLLGCTTKHVFVEKPETLRNATITDIQSDGTIEYWFYTFEPIYINGTKIQRLVEILNNSNDNSADYNVTVSISVTYNLTTDLHEVVVYEPVPYSLGDPNRFEYFEEPTIKEEERLLIWKSQTFGNDFHKEILYRAHTNETPDRLINEFSQANVYISPAPFSPIPAISSYFVLLTNIFGTYTGFSIFLASLAILLFWLVFFIKLVVGLLRAIYYRLDLLDALYHAAGHGTKEHRNTIVISAMLILLGTALIYGTEKKTSPLNDIDSFLSNINKLSKPTLLGSLLLALGIVAAYIVIADLFKGRVLGSRYYEEAVYSPTLDTKVVKIKENEILEAVEELQKELHVLSRQISDAKSIRINFVAEEIEIPIISRELNEVLSLCRKQKYKTADEKLQDIRTRVERLKHATTMKHDVYTAYLDKIGALRNTTSKIGELIEKCAAADIDASQERNALKAIKTEEVMQEIFQFYEKGDYSRARIRLDGLNEKHEKILSSLEQKLSKVRDLEKRFIKCMACGKQISLKYDSCPHCNVNIYDALMRAIHSLRIEIDDIKSKTTFINNAGIPISNENAILREAESLLNNAEKNANSKKYDNASRYIDEAKERLNKLKSSVNYIYENVKNLEKRISEIKTNYEYLVEVLSTAKKEGIDTRAEEEELSKLGFEGILLSINSLVKLRNFEEAENKLSSSKKKYDEIKDRIQKKYESFRSFEMRLSELEKEKEIALDLVAQNKNLGINVSSEESQLKAIDIPVLWQDIRTKPVGMQEGIVDSVSHELRRITETLSTNIQLYNEFSDKKQQLESLMSDARSLISRCFQLGVDTAHDEKILESISIKDIDAKMGENLHGAIKEVETAIISVNGVITDLTDKMGIAEQWDKWSASIDAMLKYQDRITTDMLVAIPEKWRKWAMHKYLAEHVGEALVIEEDAITKIKVKPLDQAELKQIIDSLASLEHVEGVAIVRKDGLLIASKLQKELSPELVSAIMAKTISNSEMVSSELGKGAVYRITIVSEMGKTVALRAGKSAIIVCLIKPAEDIGFILMALDDAARKIGERMG